MHLLIGAKIWQLDPADGETSDIVDWLTLERAHELAGPLVALSRQQVVTQLGRGIPADFPPPDVVIGDPEEGGTRGWWEATVQGYLGGAITSSDDEGVQQESATPDDAASAADDEHQWPRKSRQWDDVEYSGADHRILIATSHGIATPAGVVVSRPLSKPDDLTKLAVKYQWSARGSDPNPQIWITGQALAAVAFPSASATQKNLPKVVEEFFGATVTYAQSGFFACQFNSPDPATWIDRTVDVVLMPATNLDPSKARPADRGVLGIVDTDTILPSDETDAAHLLADRITWLYGLEGALPGPRWARVGASIMRTTMSKARPNPSTADVKLVPSPLPPRIAPRGALPSQWWTQDNWRRKHRRTGPGVDVEVDQQNAYLPSAETLYLGWGTPQWQTPDPAAFDQQRPPFGLFHLTAPPGKACDGLSPLLPVPHPQMSWSKPSSFWATTVDVQQLIAPVENGGAGLKIAELDIDAAWIWPEQHQWLKGFAALLRKHLKAARAAERHDYEQMIKAIYTSVFGRMAAVGDSAWKYPHLDLQQPAWYAAIEGFTRWRAMRYARRISRELDLYPADCLADAWFYRIPEGMDPTMLEDPLRKNPNGELERANGTYRIKELPGGPAEL